MADLKRLFEVADEFGMTTGQAMDLCDRLGIVADSGTTLLTVTEATALRDAAHRAGLGARAVGPAAGPGVVAPAASVAPPPGWVRVADLFGAPEPDPPSPAGPAELPEGPSTGRRRRGSRRGRSKR